MNATSPSEKKAKGNLALKSETLQFLSVCVSSSASSLFPFLISRQIIKLLLPGKKEREGGKKCGQIPGENDNNGK